MENIRQVVVNYLSVIPQAIVFTFLISTCVKLPDISTSFDESCTIVMFFILFYEF